MPNGRQLKISKQAFRNMGYPDVQVEINKHL
jgi:hypothetical protein